MGYDFSDLSLEDLVRVIASTWESFGAHAIDGQLHFDGFEQTRKMETLIAELVRRMK